MYAWLEIPTLISGFDVHQGCNQIKWPRRHKDVQGNEFQLKFIDNKQKNRPSPEFGIEAGDADNSDPARRTFRRKD